MKRTTLLLAILFIWTLQAFAQAPVDYRDVGVIVNLNDTGSVNIGKYFIKRRNIPAGNLITFRGTTSEIIDSTTFENIRKQIEDTITSRGLTNKLNYLVTTKGVPLKITRTDTCNVFNYFLLNNVRCASFDSELMLILGSKKSHIGIGDVVDVSTIDKLPRVHDYFFTLEHFSRKKFDMYLVTRLGGLDDSDAYKLIDRSGPNTLVDKNKAVFVLDDVNFRIDSLLQVQMFIAAQSLAARGWNVIYNDSASFLRFQKNVIGYIGWGFTDPAAKGTIRGYPSNQWLPGAIGTSYYSFNGSTFANTASARATLPNMIREGVSGWHAHTYEPYSFAMPLGYPLFNMYTDSTVARRYNLAEVFYNSAATLSWMGIVVGDPKTSIITHIPAKPNPSIDTVTFLKEGENRTLNSYNNSQGLYNWFSGDSAALIASGLPLDSTHPNWVSSGQSFKLPNAAPFGQRTFTYVNENISGRAYRQFTYTLSALTSISESTKPGISFTMLPNPGDGWFQLSFENPKLLKTELIIRDALGREVQRQNLPITASVTADISLSKHAKGTYFVYLQTSEGTRVEKLMVK